MNEDAEKDLVSEVFERMRSAAKEGGHKLPNLQRPPRKNSSWSGLDAPAPNKAAAEIVGDVEKQRERQAVVRDRAGTVIPPSLLRESGIRLYKKYDRRPAPIGAVLNRAIVDRGWQTHIAHGVIMTEWDQMVGEVVAQHSQVREFKDGTLVVECQSTAWATQLRLAQRQVIKTIADRVGDGVVEELKILGPKAPNWRKGRLHIEGRGPRDTYG
nr:DciA family protein [Corynebacterium lactis]